MDKYDEELYKTGKKIIWGRTTDIGGNALWIDY